MGHAELQPEDIDESISALRGAIRRTWYAFCDTTSIHGLKYTKDKETNKYIRFIWMLITLLMFICAVVMVVTFYVDYRSNPTRMNVENDHAPISSLIFPPTTICPEVMYNMQKSKEFLETLILPNFTSVPDILDLLDANYGFLYDGVKYSPKELNLFEEVLVLNNLSILQFVQKFSWSCSDLMFKCRYKDEIVPCGELFQIAHTFSGYCCSFNLNQSVLNFTNRFAHSGLRNGLSLMLYYNDSIFDRLHSYSHGFKVLIQETNAFPSAHSIIKFVPLNEEVFMTVRPTQTFCSQAVKNLAFENRQCVFPYERHLAFFRSYVGANCELNCRVELMLQLCGCYTYFFFSSKTDDRVCSYKDIPCLVDNFAAVIGRYKKTQCACYRSCEKIEYDVQVTSAPLQLNTPTIDTFYDGIKKDYSVVHIYMNSQVYRRVRHDLLSNTVTLVSNLGSAFSLFVGMSMVSAVEIIYYFSIILNKYYQQECRARAIIFEQKIQRDAEKNIKEELEATEKVDRDDAVKVEDVEN
ncbi:sodium channel protein Nach [Calliphora vicina]|uniref:sodium channel protein Nach n=1 Tax=Calliphora vicina TaxID=7373 RepID=UPI00325B1268